MQLTPRSHQKISMLLEKGVDIPNPLTLDIGDEVSVERISGKSVKDLSGLSYLRRVRPSFRKDQD